jgi:hypothetical protein
MITTTYGGSIVIGGDYTDIGTIVVISPKPGDPTGNGTALLNNLADITADATHPYMIKLGPGIYDLGTSSLQMKANVDIEGSGELTTIITGHLNSNVSGVVLGASNAEIRFLTVRNTGGGPNAVAISNNSASSKITNVTAYAGGGGTNYCVLNIASSPTLTNVTASGGSDSYGVYSTDSGTIQINHSVIRGSTLSVVWNGLGVTTYVGNTELNGFNVSNSGTLTCVGAYNQHYVALGPDCQLP